MKDGMIELDTNFAKKFGFTSDRYDGYLWKTGNTIIISMIMARKQGVGFFRNLFDKIIENGYDVKVPTPLPLMTLILEHYKFKKGYEWDDFMKCDVEIWTKKAV